MGGGGGGGGGGGARNSGPKRGSPADEGDDDSDEPSDHHSLHYSSSSTSLRRASQLYRPTTGRWWHTIRWLCVGTSQFAAPSGHDAEEGLRGLAQCLTLLREYLQRYGLPSRGDRRDQEAVLREVCRDLYAGGAPLWTLESCLRRTAEGLTGNPNVDWLLLPRKAVLHVPPLDNGDPTKINANTTNANSNNGGSTSMFGIARGFNLSRLHGMERVAVRLASYATNTRGGAGNVPTPFPKPEQLRSVLAWHRATLAATSSFSSNHCHIPPSADELSRSILRLASRYHSPWYFVNAPEYSDTVLAQKREVDDFWIVSDDERELFGRLATLDALKRIQVLDAQRKALYPPIIVALFRVLSSAGATAFWFGGSWEDMLVAGLLAVLIAQIAQSPVLSRQEKLIYEALASFIVGISSGLIALHWPGRTCFFAMALGAVLDILQGFRVVYSIIEVMSRQTVSGGADLLEGILFTGFIAYFLRVGLYTASHLMGNSTDYVYDECSNGINPYWYLLFVPLAALSWSGIFNPTYRDLLPMCFHGCLACGVDYGLSATAMVSANMNGLISAFVLSLSAGLWSRFTGRQAVGNTVAGVFALVPGAYLVRNIYGVTDSDLFFTIVERSAAIGIGAWTGSIVCSPTLLGATAAVFAQPSSRKHGSNDDTSVRQSGDPITMLYF